MARSAEVIRQWEILRSIDRARHGIGIAKLAAERGVHPRTDAAPYVREREWHHTQTIEDRDDGGIVVTLHVCNDHALRSWILGFGASARVMTPSALADAIFENATATRRRYLPSARGHARMLAIKAS